MIGYFYQSLVMTASFAVDGSANMTLNGAVVALPRNAAGPPLSLAVGQNFVSLIVFAQDVSLSTRYDFNITRLPLPVQTVAKVTAVWGAMTVPIVLGDPLPLVVTLTDANNDPVLNPAVFPNVRLIPATTTQAVSPSFVPISTTSGSGSVTVTLYVPTTVVSSMAVTLSLNVSVSTSASAVLMTTLPTLSITLTKAVSWAAGQALLPSYMVGDTVNLGFVVMDATGRVIPSGPETALPVNIAMVPLNPALTALAVSPTSRTGSGFVKVSYPGMAGAYNISVTSSLGKLTLGPITFTTPPLSGIILSMPPSPVTPGPTTMVQVHLRGGTYGDVTISEGADSSRTVFLAWSSSTQTFGSSTPGTSCVAPQRGVSCAVAVNGIATFTSIAASVNVMYTFSASVATATGLILKSSVPSILVVAAPSVPPALPSSSATPTPSLGPSSPPLPTPLLSSLVPAQSVEGGGARVTVVGSNFVAGSQYIVALTPMGAGTLPPVIALALSSTQLPFVTPAFPSGTTTVFVTIPALLATSLALTVVPGSVATTCPNPAAPYLCGSRCVATLADCRPSTSTCSAATGGAYSCLAGTCAGSPPRCPPIPNPCEGRTLTARVCPNDVCVDNKVPCPGSTSTTDTRTCASGMSICVSTGACAYPSSCEPAFTCPLNSPFMCSTGECVSAAGFCMNNVFCYDDTIVQTNEGQACPVAPIFAPVSPVLAYATMSDPIVPVSSPASVLTATVEVTAASFSSASTVPVSIEPVPASAVNYDGKAFQSLVVNVTIGSPSAKVLLTFSLTSASLSNLGRRRFAARTAVPGSTPANLCLGAGSYTCASRGGCSWVFTCGANLVVLDDGTSVTTPFAVPQGSYAVIVRPPPVSTVTPKATPKSTTTTTSGSKQNSYIFLVAVMPTVFTLFFIVMFTWLIIISKRRAIKARTAQLQQAAAMREMGQGYPPQLAPGAGAFPFSNLAPGPNFNPYNNAMNGMNQMNQNMQNGMNTYGFDPNANGGSGMPGAAPMAGAFNAINYGGFNSNNNNSNNQGNNNDQGNNNNQGTNSNQGPPQLTPAAPAFGNFPAFSEPQKTPAAPSVSDAQSDLSADLPPLNAPIPDDASVVTASEI